VVLTVDHVGHRPESQLNWDVGQAVDLQKEMTPLHDSCRVQTMLTAHAVSFVEPFSNNPETFYAPSSFSMAIAPLTSTSPQTHASFLSRPNTAQSTSPPPRSCPSCKATGSPPTNNTTVIVFAKTSCITVGHPHTTLQADTRRQAVVDSVGKVYTAAKEPDLLRHQAAALFALL